jgi:L-ascorbate metabolism protein UlaG (beta-lactamase superfamily)
MTYKISDHFNGELFFNPEPTIRSNAAGKRFGLIGILRARLKRDPTEWAKWPAFVGNTLYPRPEGEVPPGAVDVTFIGHSSFLLRFAGCNVITDPVFSKRCSPVGFAGPARVRAPGLALADLPRIDFLVLSHNHYDHCDVKSLQALRRRFPDMRIITTLGNAAFLAGNGMKGAYERDWWESVAFDGVTITVTPARHFAARGLYDRNRTLWGGMMIEPLGRPKVYFAGDTGYTKFFAEIAARLGPPDLALLPIGAYEPRWFMGPVHMNPADAVQAFADLGASQAVGMHFGTFQLTAEAIDAPERDLAAAKVKAGVAEGDFLTLDVGETRRF